MQRFLQLFCCDYSTPSQEYNNTLLSDLVLQQHNNRNNNNNNNNNNNDDDDINNIIRTINNSSRILGDTSESEDEEIIGNIFEAISQISDITPEVMGVVLCEALDYVKYTNLRMLIITNLLETTQDHNNQAEKWIGKLVGTLDEKCKGELGLIIETLPSAVLGDTTAKQQSRVLIDLGGDVRDSVREDKAKVAKKRKLVDTITEALQQSLTRLSPIEREQVIVYIFGKQSHMLKMKVILQQLFISRLVVTNPASRSNLLQKINITPSSSSSSSSS